MNHNRSGQMRMYPVKSFDYMYLSSAGRSNPVFVAHDDQTGSIMPLVASRGDHECGIGSGTVAEWLGAR